MSIVSYDLDGVLAEAPPEADKSWNKMSGPERKARQAALSRHYNNAKLLYTPPEDEFWVITARSLSYLPDTIAWLERNLPGKGCRLEMWPYKTRKTYDVVAEWKSQQIVRHDIIRHTEDNPQVVRRLRKLLERRGPKVVKFPEEVPDAA